MRLLKKMVLLQQWVLPASHWSNCCLASPSHTWLIPCIINCATLLRLLWSAALRPTSVAMLLSSLELWHLRCGAAHRACCWHRRAMMATITQPRVLYRCRCHDTTAIRSSSLRLLVALWTCRCCILRLCWSNSLLRLSYHWRCLFVHKRLWSCLTHSNSLLLWKPRSSLAEICGRRLHSWRVDILRQHLASRISVL